MTPPASGPRRAVFQADALEWLAENPADADASVVTSLPDVSELPELGLDRWRAWFVGAAARVIAWAPADGVSIFYQSDVKVRGAWIDKGYLVMRAAEEARAEIVWHKIVCRRPPGTAGLGRPTYSHMICVAKAPRPPPRRAGVDVLPDAGAMPWSRAMGVEACRVACRYLIEETDTRTVVDPFCGRGTVLAVANAMGLSAVGVDLSAKRCRAARALTLALGESSGDALLRGARLFDAGAYFEAHEAWEERWRAEQDARERRALQGLIQIAAALHQLFVLGSEESAARLLAKGLAKLEEGPDALGALDLAALRDAVRDAQRALAEGRLDRAAAPTLSPADPPSGRAGAP